MERRLLIGLQQIAETGARTRRLNNAHLGLWLVTAVLGLVAAWRALTRPLRTHPLGMLIIVAAVFQILTFVQPPLLVGVVLVTLTIIAMRRLAARSLE